jgi:precorrin-6B C5,15-methyltransferase / cobalt-precorrin-6B C5,C15-methyltransferase
MKPINIIGIGLSIKDLTETHLERIRRADILVGGKRHLALFKDTPAVKREISRDLKGLIRYLKSRRRDQSIVVLASGDPLFFGIGERLIGAFGAENVNVYPNISTVAAAFSRLKMPWDRVRVVSLHGRQQMPAVIEALKETDRVAVYTDPRHDPGWIAARLLDKGFRDYDICVLEKLGTPEESIGWYGLDEAVDRTFAEPNIVVLRRIDAAKTATRSLFLGSPESWFEHERGLITKAEIRAVTLSKLRLRSEHILWDLGAGSGSLSLEASLFVKRGKIFAVEKNADRVAQIRSNKQRFGVRNLKVIHAVLPEGMEALPRPDRIFIGGGGRHLAAIIKAGCGYLKPEGIIVVNSVLVENLEAARRTLRKLGFSIELIQLQVHRGREMPYGERLEAENPVWIISGVPEKRQ